VDLHLAGAHDTQHIVGIGSAFQQLLTNGDVVTSVDNTFGAVGLLQNVQALTLRELVIDDVVGAIIRCAAGIGWDGVLLAPRAADPLYRRAIKTSMGTVFQLPWARLEDWAGGLGELRDHGFTVAAMALSGDSVTLDEFSADLRQNPRKVALLMGTEGAGLSAHWISQADVVVRIPMAGGVDSLNVAAAAAVACYELREVTRVSLSE